jgi:hypothetical protein
MSLIQCTECDKEISSNATACPNCGNPIINDSIYNEAPAVTIQRTFKRWKLVKLISVLTIIIGFLSLSGGETGMAIGISLIFFGFIGLMVGKLGAWWTTG